MTQITNKGLILIDVEGIAAVQNALIDVKNGALRAMTRALNRTSDKAKVEAIREARLDVRLTADYLRKNIQSAKDSPANKATFTRLESRVTARKRGVQMGRFVTNAANVGFGFPRIPPRTKVKPTGSSTQWKGGFLLSIGDGTAVGLFTRSGGKLESRYGPSPSQIWQSEKDVIAPAMSDFMALQLQTETVSILRQALARRG